MESKELYYTPNIEDFCVGYKCQYNDHWNDGTLDPNMWVDITLDEDDYTPDRYSDSRIADLFYKYSLSKVRTKFLDKKDIESLEWRFAEENIEMGFPEMWYKGNYSLRLLENYRIGIHKFNFKNLDSAQIGYHFLGYCPSINELKKIEKLLKIKN